MDSLTATDLRAVGEFRLLARLGSGGMGQVFLGSSLAGRMVAVKVIHAELSRDPEFVRRFRHEVEAAQKVSGWYTAPVIAAGVDDNPPWLATAFVPGPSLEDIVARHGPLPGPAVWRLAAGLAEALRAIHGTGLVHRDLKPANVLLAIDGPRVIDFGISRAVTAETRLTATGAVIGTLSYMSPEQVQAQETGPGSDTFSLGSVLAFAASGAGPFSVAPGAPSAAVMFRIVHAEPDLAAVPAEVRGLIEACLAKDPRERPDLGRVAAYATAAAERLGLSPAAFWPHDVAGVIQAQQAALAGQIESLQTARGTRAEGGWGAPAGAGGRHSPRHQAPAPSPGSPSSGSPSPGSPSSGSPSPGSTAARPTAAPGFATDPGAGNGGSTFGGQAVPWPANTRREVSRRGLLIGAGVGGVAVIGGVVGWALNSGSATPTSSTAGNPPTGGVPTGGVPTQAAQTLGQEMQKYYGDGTRRAAAWKFATGNAITANPGAGGGLVCVGSTDNNLYAVNAADGRRAWSYQSGAVTAAPEVVGGVVCLSTSRGHFYALRVADGTRAWDVDTGVPAIYKPTWAVDGGNVILAQEVVPAQSYNAATGAKGVSFSTQEPYLMALTAANGILYALDATGVFYAFRTATGAEIWHGKLLSADEQPGTGLTVDGDAIYLGTVSGTLYAVSAATGHVRWTYHPGNAIESSLAVDGGMVYLKDGNGSVHAVDTASGKKTWSRPSVPTGLWGVTVAGGRVYYSTDLAVQALDAKTGMPVLAFTPLGTASGTATFLSTPAVANGKVFVGSSDDSLYAFQA
jgi:serine/threonine protein kinase/outer membrane protein assembly factor BamB